MYLLGQFISECYKGAHSQALERAPFLLQNYRSRCPDLMSSTAGTLPYTYIGGGVGRYMGVEGQADFTKTYCLCIYGYRPEIDQVAQSCLTLWDPVDYTAHKILQARMLEWVACLFSRWSSQPRDQTQVSLITGWFFSIWATGEAPRWPLAHKG